MFNKRYFFRRHMKMQSSQLPQHCQADAGVVGALGISRPRWFEMPAQVLFLPLEIRQCKLDSCANCFAQPRVLDIAYYHWAGC
jgi:hypothetical protein